MSQGDLSYYGLDALPRFGKDHLVLADWRLSLPHQRRGAGEGNSIHAVEYEFHHAGGSKKVSLEGGAKTGLPSDSDDLFLVGLLTLAAAMDFPEKLYFEPSHILHVLRLPVRDRHIIRQRQAYERFVALTAMFEGAWFDRRSKSASGDFITGILAEVYYQPKRGRRTKGERPASYVQFTSNFHDSLLAGNLINIDLDLLSTWSSPTAALNFRHLNKVWHNGRKPFRYSRDLRDLACGQLKMTDGKNLKENYAKVLREMEQKSYLAPMPMGERFESIRRGVWRVHFELHPARRIQAKKSVPNHSEESTLLVQQYVQLRHGEHNRSPAEHELRHAEKLLSEHSLEILLKATPPVVEQVKKQQKEDLHFGFAVPYYQKQISRHKLLEKQSRELAGTVTKDQAEQQRLETQQQRRDAKRQQRQQVWAQASREERTLYVQRALDAASSSLVRDRILNSTLENPPSEVLREASLSLPQ